MASPTGVVLPSAVLEDLKCVRCSLYLSVPPIMYNYEQALVCGRCENQGNLLIRARAFETVAKLFYFPCRYVATGCSKTHLNWDMVEGHEASCIHLPMLCPSLDNCEWKGGSNMILDHFKEKHDYLMYLAPFHINLGITTREVKLIKCLGEVFFLELENNVEEGKMRFRIVHIAFQQEVKADNISYTSTLDLKNSDNSNIIKLNYNIKSNYQWNFAKSEMLETSIDVIKAVLNTPEAVCSILIVNSVKRQRAKKKTILPKEENQTEASATPSSEIRPKLDRNLLNELECPICNEYMILSIFVCKNGHSICGDCKEQLKANCPTCRAPLGNTRNFALEKLTSFINYPCKNESAGCNFIGGSKTIGEHNKNCKIKVENCPLKEYEHCNWKGLSKNIPSHMKGNHAFNCWITVNKAVYRDLSYLIPRDCNIMFYEGQLFKICCKHSTAAQGPVSWAFQHIGLDPNEVSPYKFEIEFLDQTSNGRKFIINAPCQRVVEEKDTFQNCLTISHSLLEPYIISSKLIFKYHIQRNNVCT